MPREYVVVRKWLNPVNSYHTGHIRTEHAVLGAHYPSIELKIADCSRSVSFEFDDLTTKRGVLAAKKKLTIMRDAIQGLIDYTTNLEENNHAPK